MGAFTWVTRVDLKSKFPQLKTKVARHNEKFSRTTNYQNTSENVPSSEASFAGIRPDHFSGSRSLLFRHLSYIYTNSTKSSVFGSQEKYPSSRHWITSQSGSPLISLSWLTPDSFITHYGDLLFSHPNRPIVQIRSTKRKYHAKMKIATNLHSRRNEMSSSRITRTGEKNSAP